MRRYSLDVSEKEQLVCYAFAEQKSQKKTLFWLKRIRNSSPRSLPVSRQNGSEKAAETARKRAVRTHRKAAGKVLVLPGRLNACNAEGSKRPLLFTPRMSEAPGAELRIFTVLRARRSHAFPPFSSRFSIAGSTHFLLLFHPKMTARRGLNSRRFCVTMKCKASSLVPPVFALFPAGRTRRFLAEKRASLPALLIGLLPDSAGF